MAETSTGTDAWIDEAHPKANHSSGGVVRLLAGSGVRRRAEIHMPTREIRGRTVLTGTLTATATGSNAAQTLTVHLLSESYSDDKVNWDGQPDVVSGVSGSVTIGALADGETAQIPVTTLLSQIASGAKNHGFRISTDATVVGDSNWYSFDSGHDSWKLSYELSTAPTTPTDQRPDGGAASTGAPVLGWSNVDIPGDSSEQSGFQVQIDPAQDGVSPAYDSGTVTSTDPEYDLTTSTYPGLAPAATTSWRVRTTDGTEWSNWSDWATFTNTAKRTVVFDSPTGGTIGDPTPDILAHISAGTLTRYRIFVTKGGDRSAVLYDTGRRNPDAGSVDTSIPWRDPDDEKRIIRHDGASYQIGVRMWDEVTRAQSAGDPTWIEGWVTVTFDEGANEVPGSFTVAQATPGDPRVTFQFTRSEAPEAVLFTTSEGQIYARVDIDDLDVAAGVYTWRDRGGVEPYEPTTFTARAIDAGSRSAASAPASITVKPVGAWLIPEDPAVALVRMRGKDPVDSFNRVDRVATFQPQNVDHPVNVRYGRNGVSGDWVGTIDTHNPTTGAVRAAAARLEDLFDLTTARPHFIYATKSLRVSLSNGYVGPSSDFVDNGRIHNVRFHFEEIPD